MHTYTLVINVVIVVLARVPKELIVEHNVLPCNGLIQLELDLVHFVSGLHVYEEVCVVKDGIHQQVGTVLDLVDLPC